MLIHCCLVDTCTGELDTSLNAWMYIEIRVKGVLILFTSFLKLHFYFSMLFIMVADSDNFTILSNCTSLHTNSLVYLVEADTKIGCFQGDQGYTHVAYKRFYYYSNDYYTKYDIADCYSKCLWKPFIGLVRYIRYYSA